MCSKELQHTETHRNIQKYTATHCNTLQQRLPGMCSKKLCDFEEAFLCEDDGCRSTARVFQCVAVSGCLLQCVAVCCSVLQCVTVCCSVLQCVAVCSTPTRISQKMKLHAHARAQGTLETTYASCSVLQCVAVCCSVLRCVAVCCSVFQYVAVRCNV